MKQFRKEHVDDIYLGNIFFPDFVNNSENSFSKSMQEFDGYPCSKELIGETDLDVQSMGMHSSDI